LKKKAPEARFELYPFAKTVEEKSIKKVEDLTKALAWISSELFSIILTI
jgi:hypothetical protein